MSQQQDLIQNPIDHNQGLSQGLTPFQPFQGFAPALQNLAKRAMLLRLLQQFVGPSQRVKSDTLQSAWK